ncbi:helix-turn-helix domain-containing protein [Chloroflexus sp. MS-CIW-1]|uniref:helix-turn-helix domain-containing protein n=1 Tax=Chloroflexus sp. MS-CIW-1 TaxID=3055768 RepID=UPI003462A772
MQLTHKIALCPTPEQVDYFKRACGTARRVWNWALNEWNKQYAAGGKPNAMALKNSSTPSNTPTHSGSMRTDGRGCETFTGTHTPSRLLISPKPGKDSSPTSRLAKRRTHRASRKRGVAATAFMLPTTSSVWTARRSVCPRSATSP